MARAYGKVLVTIWRDEEFRALSATAQRLYLYFISSPDLSLAGVLPMRVSKWAKAADDLISPAVRDDLDSLREAGFVLVDDETEEVMVRSFIKNDEGYRTPNMRKAIGQAIAAIESEALSRAAEEQLARVTGTHRPTHTGTHTATLDTAEGPEAAETDAEAGTPQVTGHGLTHSGTLTGTHGLRDGQQHHHHLSPTPTPAPSSSSRCEPTSVPARQDDDDEESFIDQVIAHIASERLKGRRTNNPAGYKAKVAANLAADRPAIEREHERYPSLDARQLAEHYEARPELHAGATA